MSVTGVDQCAARGVCVEATQQQHCLLEQACTQAWTHTPVGQGEQSCVGVQVRVHVCSRMCDVWHMHTRVFMCQNNSRSV